ncbi:hypothetical protein [Methanoregula sp.]|uniref:hypothetical protein n=1 Tax=Methanoregula sp. TaxID=2052170 RepID=UPI00261310C1|nr:hypothetical protein [Methanoregula sp.]MDD5143635.1 hypothetical protein [Methanoregula sp.]
MKRFVSARCPAGACPAHPLSALSFLHDVFLFLQSTRYSRKYRADCCIAASGWIIRERPAAGKIPETIVK